VSAPDGRAWTIRVAHYRLPRPGEEVDDEDELFTEIIRMLPLRCVLLAPSRRWYEAVDEIAVALERGETRPGLFTAEWVARDRGGVVLPRRTAS
jgi:hypothetical protein